MIRILALIALLLSATLVMAMPPDISVNCDAGQSITRSLNNLNKWNNKDTPIILNVKGTCTEYVLISGFEGLTIKGLGATITQPSTDPGNGLTINVVTVASSRSVTISGFTILSRSSALADIGIAGHSSDIRLRNLTLQGAGIFGASAYEGSQISLANVTVRDPGYAAVSAYDLSDVHVEDCLFENTTGSYWHTGLDVGSGHVTIHGTTIRNMQVGMNVYANGIVDLVDFNTYYRAGGNTEVMIENPAGTNFYGVQLRDGASLNLNSAKLRITNAGQPWGSNTGGIWIGVGSKMEAGANLVISGSQGQGLFVSDNSHATLGGSSITGSGHGGVVVVNQSSVDFGGGMSLTQVSGNAADLFCDAHSMITGGANVAFGSNQCGNLLASEFDVIP